MHTHYCETVFLTHIRGQDTTSILPLMFLSATLSLFTNFSVSSNLLPPPPPPPPLYLNPLGYWMDTFLNILRHVLRMKSVWYRTNLPFQIMLHVRSSCAHVVWTSKKWPHVSYSPTANISSTISSSLLLPSGSNILKFRYPTTMTAAPRGRCSMALTRRSIK